MFLFNKYFKINKLMFFVKRHKKYLINHFVFKKSVYFFFQQISILLYTYLFFKPLKFNLSNVFRVNIYNLYNNDISNYLIYNNNKKNKFFLKNIPLMSFFLIN